MHGVVNLDKPVGPTSHDMVALLRRLTGIRRIGHAGTLDPLASGVLPVLIGAATRFSDELTGGNKRYDAIVRLGARSLTDDAQGPIEKVDAPLPDDDAIAATLGSMAGVVSQLPPAFSARKLGGRTAHRAARAGDPLDLPAREVVIHALDVRGVARGDAWVDVDVDIRCGAGTYVRSIARDLGERLGTGGYLRALRRTEAAGLRAEDAVTPTALEELAADGRVADAVLAVGPLLSLPRLELDPRGAARFGHGGDLQVADAGDGRVAAFVGERLLGIGTVTDGVLSPTRVVPGDAVLS